MNHHVLHMHSGLPDCLWKWPHLVSLQIKPGSISRPLWVPRYPFSLEFFALRLRVSLEQVHERLCVLLHSSWETELHPQGQDWDLDPRPAVELLSETEEPALWWDYIHCLLLSLWKLLTFFSPQIFRLLTWWEEKLWRRLKLGDGSHPLK